MWRNIAILLGLVILFALLYLLWHGFRSGIGTALGMMSTRDISQAIENLREYIRSFGVWAPLVSAALMVLQSVLFPVPGQVVTISNGLLFGAFWGTLLSWSSAMVGALVCFFIARALGRPTVEKLASKKALAVADRFFCRYGNNSVLIARLIPVVSFDAVSYLAGVTSISFLGFIVATGIGQIPATIVYSVLGQNLTKVTSLGIYAFGIIVALVVLGFTLKKAFERRLSSRPAEKSKE
ncbi:MAG: TVP38/TMEM64 family protein [Chloroflexi bacterium]|nr:TVP38/TMEM64 family protein [Chloroflexota bacterium]